MDHPVDHTIGDPNAGVRTRSRVANSTLYVAIKDTGIIHQCLYSCLISQVEPKNIQMALRDSAWVEAMQEELVQFEKLHVWDLVDLSPGEFAIGTKWVFKCKRDVKGIVIRNKARLVVKGFNQQEGIHYDKIFAPVAR